MRVETKVKPTQADIYATGVRRDTIEPVGSFTLVTVMDGIYRVQGLGSDNAATLKLWLDAASRAPGDVFELNSPSGDCIALIILS